MKLQSYPVLKFRTKDRIHICKEPGLLSWAFIISVTSLGILTDYYIIPDYFILHAGFLSMCLIFSLNLMTNWDLIMDREENLGTLINRKWYHVFSIRVPEENVQRFPLSSITSVVVTSDHTIDIKRRNGSSTQIMSEGNNYSLVKVLDCDDLNFRLLKALRKEISVFLSLERIENLKDSDTTFYDLDMVSWNSSLGVSENQESDNEFQENNEVPQESESIFGSNIKIITGIL
ncbi:hypothetical protein RUM44_003060 [Polyplax serrata]|uniref:Essential for reactive oxygen species protein n=1 Tax=Polyplax serrata TaxID=468196 RepID=A0ABR1AXG3_POLSC